MRYLNASTSQAETRRYCTMVSVNTFVSAAKRSIAIHFQDSVGKSLRRFLRQIVTDAAGDKPLGIFAGEFFSISCVGRMRRAVGIAFHGDGRHRDLGRRG